VGIFETGKVAMYPAGGWNMAAFAKLDFNWAIAPLPKYQNNRVAPYWLGGWNIPKTGKAQDAAFKFASWSATSFQPQMAKDHDWIPLRTSDQRSTFEQLWNNKLTPEKAAKLIDQKGNALLTS
jgi:multiple sugar transport system substrate-binding protein